MFPLPAYSVLPFEWFEYGDLEGDFVKSFDEDSFEAFSTLLLLLLLLDQGFATELDFERFDNARSSFPAISVCKPSAVHRTSSSLVRLISIPPSKLPTATSFSIVTPLYKVGISVCDRRGSSSSFSLGVQSIA